MTWTTTASCNKMLDTVKVSAVRRTRDRSDTSTFHDLKPLCPFGQCNEYRVCSLTLRSLAGSLFPLLSFYFSACFWPRLTPSAVNAISLYAVAFDPSIYVSIHLDFKSSDTLDALWRSRISLSPSWLGFRNRSTGVPRIDLPAMRQSLFFLSFFLSFLLALFLFFRRKKKKKRDATQWRSTGRQACFAETRVLVSRPPLMD